MNTSTKEPAPEMNYGTHLLPPLFNYLTISILRNFTFDIAAWTVFRVSVSNTVSSTFYK